MPTTNRLSGDLRSAVCSWCRRTAKGAVAFVVRNMSVLEPCTQEDLEKDIATLTAAGKGAISLLASVDGRATPALVAGHNPEHAFPTCQECGATRLTGRSCIGARR
jgi:hypothetical protein